MRLRSRTVGLGHAMSRAVQLQMVRVSRAPGIDEPFTVSALSPGLNLVHGPNASGKSTLVRVFEALLWPDTARRPMLVATGRYRVGEMAWQVALDAGACAITVDGAPARAPDFPSPTMRHRYVLSLHDLLAATESDGGFAREITRASAGGLDLAHAGREVGASDTPTRSSAMRKAFDEAQAALRHASDAQAGLFARGAQLAALIEARDAAADADAQRRRLDLALEHHAARDRGDVARRAIAQLPAVVQAFTAGTHASALALLERWQQQRDELREATQRLAQARDARDAAFAHTPPDRVQVATWRALVQQWQGEEAAVSQADATLAAARARRDEARHQLGAEMAHEPLHHVTLADVQQLVALADRLEQARAVQRAAHAVWQRTLTDRHADQESEPAQADVLQDAMRVLVRWLAADAQAAQPTPTASPWPLLLLAGLAVAGWGIAAWPDMAWALLGLLAAALVSIWAWRERRGPAAAPDARPTYERDYERLGVSPPIAWQHDAVIAQLHRLAERFARRDAQEQAQRQAAAAALAHTEATRSLETVEAERMVFVTSRAITSDDDTRTLSWWLDRFVRWQDAQLDVVAAEHAYAHGRMALEATRTTFLTSWADGARVQPSTALAASGLLDDLEHRRAAWHAAQQSVEAETQRVERLNTLCMALQSQWRRQCEPLGLNASEPDDPMHDASVHATLEQLAQLETARVEYDELRVAARDAERDAEAIAARAGDAPAFLALLRCSRDTLVQQREDAAAHAERYAALVSEVALLEQELARARHAHAVEQALAHRDEVRATLEEQYDAQVDALLAHALLQHLAVQTRDVHRPAVFHRARALFAQITHGRWRLHLDDDGDAPRFCAEETRTLQRRSLDELSSGTRVQLLVAVRVAFVEHEEGDVRLPLFFDETLGTSDDQRASALIEAVLTLVQQGRQVFYFTAQHDEVAKWEQSLAVQSPAIPWCAVDLAAVRALPATEPLATTPVVPPPRRWQPPEPAGHTHASYGELLGVPAVTPGDTPLGATPLWYLLDELPVLYASLSMGIPDWGALSWYLDAGGALLVDGLDADTVSRALASARDRAALLAVLHEYAARGRGRRVDRTGLMETGAVSDRFLPDVTQLALLCAGDALKVLAQLEDGAVPGFGTARLGALREALVAHGFVPTEAAPSAAELRLAMIARAGTPHAADRVDALLERLRQRRPSGADTLPP